MKQDRWSRWLLERRFGGDEKAAAAGMRQLAGVRERVLDGAKLRAGDTLLDVGAGDGLIAFGALERVGERGRVIFSDISRALLEHSKQIHHETKAGDGRCIFVQASADHLPLADASVDVVTTRSVLIYVRDKIAALAETHRVLRPGGRLSIFEPINRFDHDYLGRDERWTGGGADDPLERRLRDFFQSLQPLDSDPMMDFNEKDLLRLCEQSGFRRARMQLEVHVRPAKPARWDAVVRGVGNPNIPSMAEAMDRIFTPEERARFEELRRPVIEAGGTPTRGAAVYLVAVKDGGSEEETD